MPKLKIDAATGKAEVRDGLPVYVNDDGSELTYDLPKILASVGATRDERDTWKNRAESAERVSRLFGASEDEIKSAAEKLKLARALDEKKLIDAGKVDEVVSERLKSATAEWGEKERTLAESLNTAKSHLRKVLIENKFATSKVLDGYIPTWDLLYPVFERHFDVDGENVVAFRDPEKKNRIYSASDPNKLADVDEALGLLLKAHPQHDRWKKGANANGSDAKGNARPNDGKETAGLPPVERLAAAFTTGKPAN